jgi:hypothetical protein
VQACTVVGATLGCTCALQPDARPDQAIYPTPRAAPVPVRSELLR